MVERLSGSQPPKGAVSAALDSAMKR